MHHTNQHRRTIIDRLRDGETVRVLSMGAIPDFKLIEIAGRVGGFEGLWIDQEHGAVTHQQMEVLLLACRAVGMDAFARVPLSDYATLMRPMETGCSGVMVAQIRSMDEVERAVQWVKYPPIGQRGLFLGNAEAHYGTVPAAEHVAAANAQRWLAVQIETAEAVEQVQSIAQTPGVDLLFVGPGDLACTLGVPGEPLHAKCVDALERVAQACREASKPWGVLSRHRNHADLCRELGCQLFSIASDVDLIHRGLAATRELFAPLFP